MGKTYGNLCSWFYDIDKPIPPKEELDFYLSFASKNMTILEPMCGSGRFLTEFVKRGFTIDGFDLSKDMIEKCHKKLEKMNPTYNLKCCTFSQFKPTKKYDLILIPSNSFSLITDHNEILSSLEELKELLASDGKLVMSVETIPDNQNISVDENKSKRTVTENEFKIDFIYLESMYDKLENILYSKTRYKLYKDGKLINSEDEQFNIKCYKTDELEKYLEVTGLKPRNKYFNYSKADYSGQKTEALIYIIVHGLN